MRNEPDRTNLFYRTVQANHSFLFQMAFFAAGLMGMGTIILPSAHRLMKPNAEIDGCKAVSLKRICTENGTEQKSTTPLHLSGGRKIGGLIAL